MAEPISMAVAAWLIPAGATAMQMAIIEIGVGLALSALSRAIIGKPEGEGAAGLRTDVTLEGGTLPQTMIVGKYATGGTFVAPFYAYGESDDIDNAYRVYIIDIADFPVDSLRAIWINDTKFNWTDDFKAPQQEMREANKGEWANDYNLRVGFWDGRQTTASAYLIDRVGNHSKRPWTSDFVGVGVAYVVVTLRLNQELVQGEAQVRVEVNGARLYNRSQDSTNGGSGTQREGQTGTHGYTDNNITIVENIMRGITLPDGRVWGLGVEWSDLPMSNWNTARSVCNQTVGTGANARNRYNCGYEIRMATADNGGDDPFDVIDELLRGCSGSIVDVGGTFYVRAGPPALPIVNLTDEDILVDRPQEQVLHEGLKDVYNSFRARFPNPKQQWKASEAPLYSNSGFMAEDGEMLLADMVFNSVWDQRQIQSLQREYIKDSRRLRRHTLVLPPRFSNLIPLNVFSWTSPAHGYVTKSFEILEVAIDPMTLASTISCREVDPNDYNPEEFIDREDPDDSPVVYVPGPLPGFAAQGVEILDGTGGARRAGIKYTWPKRYSGVTRITVDLRVKANAADAPDKVITNIGKLTALQSEGILPNTLYEYRVKSNKSNWSGWVDVLTPNVKLGAGDVDIDGGGDGLPATTPTGLSAVGLVRAIWVNWNNNPEPDLKRYEIYHRADTAIPASPTPSATVGAGNSFVGIDTIPGTPPTQLGDNVTRYVWVRAVDSDGASPWAGPVQATTLPKLGITSADLVGMVDATSFAANLKPVQVVTSAPGAVYLQSDLVLHNGEVYRWNGSAYVKSIKAADLIDKLIAGQIEVGAVGASEIAAGAIATRHLSVMDFENIQPVFTMEDGTTVPFNGSNSTRSIVAGGGVNGGNALRVDKTSAANGGQGLAYGRPDTYFPVNENDVFWVEHRFKETNGVARAGAYNFGIRFYDGAKTLLSTNYNDVDSANNDGPFALGAAWSRQVKQINAPSGARYGSFVSMMETAQPAGASVLIDRAIPRKAGKGELLVDGTIKGVKLEVASLAATLANIGTAYISRAHIVSGEITRAKIEDAAINDAKIENAAVTTAKITDLAVTRGKIRDLAVDTLKIRNQAVTVAASAYSEAAFLTPQGSDSFHVTPAALKLPSMPDFDTDLFISLMLRGRSGSGSNDDDFGGNGWVGVFANGNLVRSWYVGTESRSPVPFSAMITDRKERSGVVNWSLRCRQYRGSSASSGIYFLQLYLRAQQVKR